MISYSEAGVSIDAGNSFVKAISPLVKSTANSGVIGGIGSFSGAFRLPSGYKNPVLLAATDGVGTKLRLAIDAAKVDTVGIDLVAMCVNDLICNFATPLFFLDYYATAKLDIASATAVVEGIARGCREAGCALIGGETAEMPGMYSAGDFDLAGFAVGMAEEGEIDRTRYVAPGAVLIALPSSGLHSNGYSLARAVVKKRQLNLGGEFDGRTLIEALLEPTRIYVRDFLAIKDEIMGLAHITGGGIVENLPRIFPAGVGARIERAAIKKPAIYDIFDGVVEVNEMERTFNCGVGAIIVADEKNADSIMKKTGGYIIGHTITGDGVEMA